MNLLNTKFKNLMSTKFNFMFNSFVNSKMVNILGLIKHKFETSRTYFTLLRQEHNIENLNIYYR